MLRELFKRLVQSESVRPPALPPGETMIQLDQDTWEAELPWKGGRARITALLSSVDVPSETLVGKANELLRELERFERQALAALRAEPQYRALEPEGFRLRVLDVGSERELAEGLFSLHFRHGADPQGSFVVHFNGGFIETVVRND
jgi:hypothetical protein